MRDQISEHAVLGAVMVNPEVGGPALLGLDAEEFSAPHDRALASLLMDMLRRDEHIDPLLVHNQITARGIFPAQLQAGYLFKITQACLYAANAPGYAAQVREVFRQRKALATAQRLVARLDDAETDLELADLDSIIETGRQSLDLIPESLERKTATPPMTLAELLKTKAEFDWLIPGLIERSERLMLTGQEGLGKSVLLRQLAVCLAAGIHPFTGQRVSKGFRVLHVDVENGMGQSRRGYSRLAEVINRMKPDTGWQDRLMVVPRPEGLDLAGVDRSWWDRTCSGAAPDVIITGPIYRLSLGNPNSEEDVRKLVNVIDGSRVRHNAALLLEAHAGHGSNQPGAVRSMRPSGASLWMRWPENGLGLRHAKQSDPGDRTRLADLGRWRLSREERAWPYAIDSSHYARGGLPWTPTDPEYDGTLESLVHP